MDRANLSYLPSCVNLSWRDILVPPRMRRRPPAEADGAVWFIVEAAGMREAAQSAAEGKEIIDKSHSPPKFQFFFSIYHLKF